MKKSKIRNGKGSVSLFVMVAMLFFLVVMIGVFSITSKKAQTQTQAVGMVQDEYYEQGEEKRKYAEKMVTEPDKIPIYTKEQWWSIGENRAIEIDGRIYDFSEQDFAKYELKNDIVINIETDLEKANFKDNLFYQNRVTKNNYKILYYSNQDEEKGYYVPVSYTKDAITVSCEAGKVSSTKTTKKGETYQFAKIKTVEDLGITSYGKMMDGYALSQNDCGWQIFHIDEKNIYLIASNYISESSVPKGRNGSSIYQNGNGYKLSMNTVYQDYTGSEDISKTHVAYKWLTGYLSRSPSNKSISMKSVAYMMDTTMWNPNFCNSQYAEYAIGGPTIELFVASYNKTHPDKPILASAAQSTAGYKIKWATSTTYANAISGLGTTESQYVLNSTTKANGMWLASPSAYTSGFTINYIMSVRYTGAASYDSYTSTILGFRPIVCLKSNVKLVEKEDGSYKIIN